MAEEALVCASARKLSVELARRRGCNQGNAIRCNGRRSGVNESHPGPAFPEQTQAPVSRNIEACGWTKMVVLDNIRVNQCLQGGHDYMNMVYCINYYEVLSNMIHCVVTHSLS